MSSFTVGIFLPEKNITDHPFDVGYYRQSYFELAQEITALGGEMLIVRDATTYLGQGSFARAWSMLGPENYEKLAEVTVDVIFDKGEFPLAPDIPIFNHPEINEICTDKFIMYERFQKFCPLTVRAATPQEYVTALDAIHTDKAVIKPITGQEGHGIMIAAPAALKTKFPSSLPVVVQEFLDTSGGVPGIMQGSHDLRVALFDGEIIYSYLRTPPPGKLTANVAQGGKFFMVEPRQLPVELFPIIQEIDHTLAHVGHRFYGIDFGITPGGPKIIEMNARLGLLPNQDSPAFVVLKKKLARTFAQMSEKK
jgi:hypothetical protein